MKLVLIGLIILWCTASGKSSETNVGDNEEENEQAVTTENTILETTPTGMGINDLLEFAIDEGTITSYRQKRQNKKRLTKKKKGRNKKPKKKKKPRKNMKQKKKRKKPAKKKGRKGKPKRKMKSKKTKKKHQRRKQPKKKKKMKAKKKSKKKPMKRTTKKKWRTTRRRPPPRRMTTPAWPKYEATEPMDYMDFTLQTRTEIVEVGPAIPDEEADTDRFRNTSSIASFLRKYGFLAIPLKYPIVWRTSETLISETELEKSTEMPIIITPHYTTEIPLENVYDTTTIKFLEN